MNNATYAINHAEAVYHVYFWPHFGRIFVFEDYLFAQIIDCFTINQDDFMKDFWIENSKLQGYTVFYNREMCRKHGGFYITEHVKDCMEIHNGILRPKPLPHPIPYYQRNMKAFGFCDTFGYGSDFEKKLLNEITIPGRKGAFIKMSFKEIKQLNSMILLAETIGRQK